MANTIQLLTVSTFKKMASGEPDFESNDPEVPVILRKVNTLTVEQKFKTAFSNLTFPQTMNLSSLSLGATEYGIKVIVTEYQFSSLKDVRNICYLTNTYIDFCFAKATRL